MTTDTKEVQPFSEALLGKELLSSKALSRVLAWPVELRATLVAIFFGSLVLLPYLGSVGLWDPWEVHYGEVAREMIQRNDYVHPYWENAWFFSKPAFTMWMQAVGMQASTLGPMLALALGVVLSVIGAGLFLGRVKQYRSALAEFWGAVLAFTGAVFLLLAVLGFATHLQWRFAGLASGDGALPEFLEWGFRLPFAGSSILAVGLMTYALSRTVNARVALASAVVLLCMPLYFLLSRQAVTDTAIVNATICGIASAIIPLLDKRTRHKTAWWYASFIFFAIATLAKELLGFGIPMVIFFFYLLLCVVPGDSKAFSRHLAWVLKYAMVPVAAGFGAALIAGAIAYAIGDARQTMFISGPPVDGKNLLSAPAWLGIMWGSLALWAVTTVMLGRATRNLTEKPPELWALFYEMRLGTGILLFLAVCLPWYYEIFTFPRVDDESKLAWFRILVHDNFARLASGVHTTTPGGDFTYFIQQGGFAMFPWVVLIPGAIATVARLRPRGGTSVDQVGVVAVLWFIVSWALIGASATKFHHYVFPMLPPMAILIGLFIDKLWTEGVEPHLLALVFGLPLLFLVGKDLSSTPKDFTDLFVYNYDRPYPAFLTERKVFGNNDVKAVLGLGFAFFGGLAAIFMLVRAKLAMFSTALTGALIFTLWFNWSHWVDLSHNWTQRDQFWRYYTQRKPGEPIAAFLMNWRGETFYSRNTVKQIKDNPNVGMAAYAAQPGRKWSLVEHNRLPVLKAAAGADKTVTLIDKDLNNKFVLVTIE